MCVCAFDDDTDMVRIFLWNRYPCLKDLKSDIAHVVDGPDADTGNTLVHKRIKWNSEIPCVHQSFVFFLISGF
jgi:hypothetical protein